LWQTYVNYHSFHSGVFQVRWGKKGNELCDMLVVCQHIIIIISVKDITPTNHEDEVVAYDRWVRKAITESIAQLTAPNATLTVLIPFS
jgi:hypothetical protein